MYVGCKFIRYLLHIRKSTFSIIMTDHEFVRKLVGTVTLFHTLMF
jgi:hypothetical protein